MRGDSASERGVGIPLPVETGSPLPTDSMDGQGAAHTFLVITDEGVYSNYSVNAYRCTEMEARQLAALRKDVARIIREKRFVPPAPNPYVEPAKQAGHYLDYGNHETIRLIQRVDGKPLMDDLSGGTGVAELIARYQSYVALARSPAPAAPTDGAAPPRRDEEGSDAS